MKKNRLKLGLGVLTVLATPIAVNAVASNDALAAQGWVKSGNTWYFYNKNGTLARNAWAGDYWLGADGKMVTNAWVDNGRYYVGSNGAWVKNAQKQAATTTNTAKKGWVQSGASWYYLDAQGRAVRNAWIGNYWLGSDGRMAVSSWVDNGRYYVGANGLWDKNAKKETPKPEVKKQGWVKSGSDWYYYENGTVVKNKWAGNYWLGSDGRMAVSSWVDNGRYYVGANGLWDKNAKKETPKPEVKKQGWVKSGSDWYYYENGTVVKNKWAGNYWLGSDGRMAVSSWVDNGRYYVGANGLWDKNAKKETPKPAVTKKQGWKKEDNAWVYYEQDGMLARNKWIGNTYWVDKDGKMVTDNWVDNDRFYVDKSGKKDPSIKKKVIINDELGWQKRNGGEWYYYEKDGSLARNKWVGNYWLGSDGKMAKSTWVDNGRYYVDSSGKWVSNYAKEDKTTPALNMPQYYQGDHRWGNKRYGVGTMAQSGCVPTSLAMVFNGLGQKVLPTDVADTIYNNTSEMNVGGIGTSGKGAVYAIRAYGYRYSVITTKEQLISALQSGKPVYAAVGPGIFALPGGSHAVILSGYSNGKTKAMDPDNVNTTGRWYDINTIWDQRSLNPYDNNIGGPFVAIG